MVQAISASELKARIANKTPFFLLDVRQLDEHNQFNIGGVLIPLNELPSRVDEIPRDTPIVVYCRSGHRSDMAASWLESQGFASIENLQGGVLAWGS